MMVLLEVKYCAEMKGIGRRITQLLDNLKNRRRYWELKEEAEDRNRWKKFINQI